MSTLPNVNDRRGGTNTSHAGFTSNVSPEVQSLHIGVSVKYVQDSNKQWFVLRATYNREILAYNYITNDKTDAFIPTHYVYKFINGKRKRIVEPLLPQLVFVYATKEKIEEYVNNTPKLSFLNYYYDHFQIGMDGKNPPLTVGYDEMINFIHVASVDDDHVMIVEPQHCHFKSGDKVKIIKGKFAGVTGRVARVAGQQRVIIEIEGLCLVATAYVPTAFIINLKSE